MAESAARFLVLWTIVCALLQTPGIQAQSTISPGILPSATSPFLSSFLATPWNSSLSSSSQSNSTIGFLSSSVDQHSSSVTNAQSSQFITRNTIMSQATETTTIAPTPSQLTSSTVTPTNKTVATSSSPTAEGSKDGFSTTEWILIACLCAFGLMFIAIIILVVQIARLNKSVNNLKITSSR